MNSALEPSKDISTRLKVVIIWLAILLLGSFWLTVRGSSDPVSLAVIPQVPREGEVVIVIFRLNNQSPAPLVSGYQFYTNGKLLMEGTTTIAYGSAKIYKYAYKNSIPLGEQLNFVVRVKSERGDYEKSLSLPPYPPQVWSSFVSFASFSTSVMNSMATMTYYQSTFGSEMGFNVGLLYTVLLMALLIFLELSQPLLREKTIPLLGKLRLRLNTVTWILFIIFMGIVYTKVVLIIVA